MIKYIINILNQFFHALNEFLENISRISYQKYYKLLSLIIRN
jgi:hypothetical protein